MNKEIYIVGNIEKTKGFINFYRVTMNRKGLIWTEEELSTAKTNSLLTKICDKLEINIRDCKKLEFD